MVTHALHISRLECRKVLSVGLPLKIVETFQFRIQQPEYKPLRPLGMNTQHPGKITALVTNLFQGSVQSAGYYLESPK